MYNIILPIYTEREKKERDLLQGIDSPDYRGQEV